MRLLNEKRSLIMAHRQGWHLSTFKFRKKEEIIVLKFGHSTNSAYLCREIHKLSDGRNEAL